MKKIKDYARACEQSFKEQWRDVIHVFLERVPIEEAGHRFLAEERHRLLDDATEDRAVFTGLWRKRRRVAAEKRRREGCDDAAGPSSAPKDSE
ncbi:hypothetical protein ACUV84_007086 [Puccinellia chinampoensis]